MVQFPRSVGMSLVDEISYLQRDAEELSKVQAERRPGRPASAREDALARRTATEEKEYETGFCESTRHMKLMILCDHLLTCADLPDVQDGRNLELLGRWTGEWTYLTTVKFVRISRDGGKQTASFPPKGAS